MSIYDVIAYTMGITGLIVLLYDFWYILSNQLMKGKE